MPGSTDLKAEMAASWKTVWKVDPLPFSVPLRLELLLAEAEDVLPAADEVDDELDDEQAARASAATANPAVATCCLRRKCISGTPYGVYRVLGRDEQPGRPAHCGARVQFAGGAGTGGKM